MTFVGTRGAEHHAIIEEISDADALAVKEVCTQYVQPANASIKAVNQTISQLQKELSKTSLYVSQLEEEMTAHDLEIDRLRTDLPAFEDECRANESRLQSDIDEHRHTASFIEGVMDMMDTKLLQAWKDSKKHPLIPPYVHKALDDFVESAGHGKIGAQDESVNSVLRRFFDSLKTSTADLEAELAKLRLDCEEAVKDLKNEVAQLAELSAEKNATIHEQSEHKADTQQSLDEICARRDEHLKALTEVIAACTHAAKHLKIPQACQSPGCKECGSQPWEGCLDCSAPGYHYDDPFCPADECDIHMCKTCPKLADRTADNQCTACHAGHRLEGATCIAHDCKTGIKAECRTCRALANRTGNDQCNSCNDGYKLDAESGRCSKITYACTPWLCKTCPAEMERTSHNECTSCHPGHYLEGTFCERWRCDADACKTCVPFEKRERHNQCASCNEGFWHNTSGSCHPYTCNRYAVTGCATCREQEDRTDFNQCGACRQGYDLKGDACKACRLQGWNCHTSVKDDCCSGMYCQRHSWSYATGTCKWKPRWVLFIFIKTYEDLRSVSLGAAANMKASWLGLGLLAIGLAFAAGAVVLRVMRRATHPVDYYSAPDLEPDQALLVQQLENGDFME
eukprot:TRINITY_DN551_c0_g1_i5.p1 TRINITY_DN551_c0_g1~~TRINITY_DN551_c0_g1_i5.p1  ORF type:complete len:656 (-),score=110.07 TRINITY_DN551_c0_g1_i5:620-2497(-)